MREAGADQAIAVDEALRVWAELAPDPSAASMEVAQGRDACWLGLDLDPAAITRELHQRGIARGLPNRVSGRPDVSRLARLDALHDNESLLELGWVVVAGTIEGPEGPRRVLQPLVRRPVAIRRQSIVRRAVATAGDAPAAEFVLEHAGEMEASHLVDSPSARARILAGVEVGGGAFTVTFARHRTDTLLRRLPRLQRWISETTIAMGLPVKRVTVELADLRRAVEVDGLVAYVGSMLFLTRNPVQASVRSSLLAWAARGGLERSALGAVLGHATGELPEPASTSRAPTSRATSARSIQARAPLPLSPNQTEVVRACRRAPVTVVSGAPGTGKTHTLCAAAMDAIAAGRSVLVATRSRAAADTVTELLERTAGPDPIRFGDGQAISGLIDELDHRRLTPMSTETISALDQAMGSAERHEAAVRRSLELALETERRAQQAERLDAAIPALAEHHPKLFDPSTDLDEVAELVRFGQDHGTGWLNRWRRRRALVRAHRVAGSTRDSAGASTDEATDSLMTALDAAQSRRAAARLSSSGGTSLAAGFEALLAASDARRRATGERLGAIQSDPRLLRDGGATAITNLLGALRAGRSRRRDLLAQLPARDLTTVTPLWVGTLSDIEDVLPTSTAMFDLVFLDEASQIDQPGAAGALARGSRAVVIGDPRQLGLTSFTADADVDRAVQRHAESHARSLLDVRRVSAFDLAAASGTTVRLREHFRSNPHLIEFPLEEFYGEEVAIMTTTPTTETADCIEVHRFDVRHSAGADPLDSEATEAVALVESMISDGVTDIGVVSPFRAHAERIEDLFADRLDEAEIRAARLRVGTVHSFQGAERDTMVIAPGLRFDDPAGRRRFANDPNLFNVMVSRARRRCIVLDTGVADGLLASYISHADGGPDQQPDWQPGDVWTRDLANGLSTAGLTVRSGYRAGSHVIDLVIDEVTGEGPPCAIETSVHPDGPAAHIARRETLCLLGWRVLDAFPSRFGHDPARAVVQLIAEVAAIADVAEITRG